MTKPTTPDTMFKPEYEGERPKGTLSGPEKQQLRLVKAAVIDRLHAAMLTLTVLRGDGPGALRAAGCPPHLVEFSDRVGEEAAEGPRARWEPTAAQVSDVPKALALLDGLRKPYYTVVKLRALEVFARENDESSPWPWEKIGAQFGLSPNWAQEVYDAAIIQATRRAGLLPMVSNDYGILIAGAWVDRAWLTNLSTASDPRQAVANLKAKSPVRLEQAVIIWVAGAPLAKRIVDAVKPRIRGAVSHGSWYKLHPDGLANDIVEAARKVGADWLYEDVAVRGALAA
jgi:hypothetical protein